MSTIELNAKAATYFDLLAQIEELTAEAEAIKDTLKEVMIDGPSSNLTATAGGPPGATPRRAGSILSDSRLNTATCTARTPSRPRGRASR